MSSPLQPPPKLKPYNPFAVKPVSGPPNNAQQRDQYDPANSSCTIFSASQASEPAWYAEFQEDGGNAWCGLFTQYLCHSLAIDPEARLIAHWQNIVDWIGELGNLLMVDGRGHHPTPYLPEAHQNKRIKM